MAAAAAEVAAVLLPGCGGGGTSLGPSVCSKLTDIEHVVIFIQENRSFDHYFGTYKGARGFSDPHPQLLPDGSGLNVFFQPGYDQPDYGGHLLPFHLESFNAGECAHDVDHEWSTQHH